MTPFQIFFRYFFIRDSATLIDFSIDFSINFKARVGFAIRVYFGGPAYWGPYYYYPPYPYYYPPTVVVPQSPPVYIERGGQAEQAPAEQGWWYFCRESNAYYPYVKHCPGGWEKVRPQPPAQ